MIKQAFSPPPFLNAAIDVGTNTLRLLIGYISDRKLIRLASKRSVTRLGRGLTTRGSLNKESLEESIKSLIQFKVLIDKYKVLNIIAVGTSALRDASNSGKFVELVKEKTGIVIDIISGKEEAELTERGIFGFQAPPLLPAFIADIGGGSTEWAIRGGRLNGTRSSVQIGAVRLNEQFLAVDPNETEKMRMHIIESIKQSFLSAGITLNSGIDGISSFVATGGTAATVAVLDMGLDSYDGDKIHLHQVSCTKLNGLYKQLSSMSLHERANVKGMETGRADIIIPGILIMLVLMELTNADTLTVSDYGLLEGLLCNIIS